jgi:hypothetical protein
MKKKKIKKFKKLKNKITGLSIGLDKNTTKLSDLDELDGVIEDFKKDLLMSKSFLIIFYFVNNH